MSKNKDLEENVEDIPSKEVENEGQKTESNGQGSEIQKLTEELDAQKDKYLRLVAEFDNVRKRNAREKIEMIQTAGKDIITSLLGVLDDCDRAEKQIEKTDDVQQIKEGVRLVFNKFRTALESKGLKAMESINSDFDVEKHEAITEVEAGKEKHGKVVDEVEKGYYLNDKLIRFAKVIVGK